MNEGHERNVCPVSGKVCYSRRDANMMISAWKGKRLRRRGKEIPKRAYFCRECGAYHLTHWKKFRRSVKEKEE